MRGSRSRDAEVQARRELILEHVLGVGEAAIDDLANRYGVSKMTVHRDLDVLSGAGYLTKRRGRAVAPSALAVQTSALFRRRAAAHLKEAVARGAVGLLTGARTVIVDGSTSVLPLLRLLGESTPEPVTVVSNYVEVGRELTRYPRLSAHLLGGDYIPHLDATFGPACLAAVARWHVDVAVLSAPAVRQGRCYHSLEASAAVKRAALDASARSILLLDHTKLPRTAPHLVCGVERFDAVVVDHAADSDEIAAMRSTGTSVVLVHAHPFDGATSKDQRKTRQPSKGHP